MAMKVMAFIIGTSLVVLANSMVAPAAEAFDLDALRERIEQRREERRLRMEERTSSSINESPENSSEENVKQENSSSEEVQPCTCSAKVKFSRPRFSWGSNGLIFVPILDVDIRTKGDPENNPWNVQLAYEGQAHDTPFAGTKQWSGQCTNGRFKHKGLELPSVTMDNLLRAMFLNDEELTSKVAMQATVAGCTQEQEEKEFSFSIKNNSKLYVRSWRNIR